MGLCGVERMLMVRLPRVSLRLYAAICLPHRISSVLEPGKSLDPSLALNADESSLDHLDLA